MGVNIVPARMDAIRNASIGPATFVPVALMPPPVSAPIICMAVSGITPVTAVEVFGLHGKMELVRIEQLHGLFNEGRIGFAYDKATDKEFLVWDRAFDEYAKAIYDHESLSAIRKFEANIDAVKTEGRCIEREIFLQIESLVTSDSSAKNLRHLSFMLKEAAEIDGDYITASAIMLHNLETRELDQVLSICARRKRSNVIRVTDAIKDTVQRFNQLNNTPYLPPVKRHEYQIQDSMNSLIKISGGNGRAVQLLFVHKLSSILMQPEDANDITGRSIRELFAPLAERFGKKTLASKLRNQAFRLYRPDEYGQQEQSIVNALSMSRKEAEDFIAGVVERLKRTLSSGDCGCHLASGRVKTPWSVSAKSEYKAELYPEIFIMTDLLAVTGVTEKEISLEEAPGLLKRALGKDFNNFEGSDNSMETKIYEIEGRTYLVHHVVVVLADGNSLEVQLMDREAYRVLDMGARAHWVYKLEKLTEQKFDKNLLQICAKKMTGNILRDVQMTYDVLSKWVYVFVLEDNTVRPIRVDANSIPVDAAAAVLKENTERYSGFRIGKVWNREHLRDAGEFNVLTDGDYLFFKKHREGYIDLTGRRAMISMAQHQETRALLYRPEEHNDPTPTSRRGKKNLRRR